MKNILGVLIGIALIVLLIPVALFILKILLLMIVHCILYVFGITAIAIVVVFIRNLVKKN